VLECSFQPIKDTEMSAKRPASVPD